MKITSKILFLITAALLLCSAISAQEKAVGKLNSWTFADISSREKDDEILPVSYKMRVSKNKNFDRIVFEFAEKEVPEYSIRYPRKPLKIDRTRLEYPEKANKEKFIRTEEIPFVLISFALQFEGRSLGEQFSGEQNLSIIADIKTVDWFENFYTFAVGLNAKKPFRVSELSNPTRLVIDFKNSGK